MNCPNCGKFMGLYYFDDVSKSVDKGAFWWCCGNRVCNLADANHAIAAPEYDFLYWYKHIPKKDLEAEPELKAEWEEAKRVYLNRHQSRAR